MVKDLFLSGTGELHWALVCLIGVAVVFVGLAAIIGLVELMHIVTKPRAKKTESVPQVSAPLIINFILPVPLASLPAKEICSEISVAGISISDIVTL